MDLIIELWDWNLKVFVFHRLLPLLVPFKCWSSFLTDIPKSNALKLNVYQQRRHHTLDMHIIAEAFTWNGSWLLLPILKQQNLGPSVCCKRSKCSGSNFNSSWRKGDQNPSTCFGNVGLKSDQQMCHYSSHWVFTTSNLQTSRTRFRQV